MSGSADERARARGKFIEAGGGKLYVRGVTYGTFRNRPDGHEYPEPAVIERDFALMAGRGINAVRTYTVPPRSLLDEARRHGLRVLVGVPVERYAGYLTDRDGSPDFEEFVRRSVGGCAGHPAVLGYCLGNEIPAPTVRWHGHRRIERLLERLCRAARREDPEAPLTYASYPSTEYLQLPFLDLLCFNVFLESPQRLEAYLARLHNLAGDRPLILGEIGLDGRRHGNEAQARCLDWQVRTAFASGCAGTFVYSWTDEWHTSGGEVTDWEFGVTRRDRTAKPALAAVSAAYSEVPFPRAAPRPRVSVVVCSYNGSRTIRECLEGIVRLDYPDFEAIVVDDGSTDTTASIAAEYTGAGVRLIRTEQRGLSNARNTGLAAATGEIVAYIDDDASPDPHWLTYLAHAFSRSPHAAVGGPNIAPRGNGLVSECVAGSPGNPVHVLLDDERAEHVPGCNIAIRRSCLEAIGGFDPRYRTAGDDVDVCWRLRDRGWTLGFNPAAMVWHRPRGSVRAFWKQQRGYGRAEALLEQKWPHKYNAAGQATWSGRVYGGALSPLLRRGGRIYHGVWGSAPYQSLYEPAPGLLSALGLMPEWYLVILALAILSGLGVLWAPLLAALPLLGLAVGATLVQAIRGGLRAPISPGRSRPARFGMRALTALLHVVQPLARLRGRLHGGLTPWRRRRPAGWTVPLPRRAAFWSERWRGYDAWVRCVESSLRDLGTAVVHGGDFDRFDLEVRGGMLGGARLLLAVEEHGAGRQLVRVRTSPRCSPSWLGLTALLVLLGAGALFDGAWAVTAVLGAVAALLATRAAGECAAASAAARRAVDEGLGSVAAAITPARRPG